MGDTFFDFLSTLSHELKNPLAGITSTNALIARRGDDEINRLCGWIHQSSQQLGFRIEDLRLLALLKDDERLSLDRSQQNMQPVLDELAALAPDRITTSLDSKLMAFVDLGRMSHALRHLVANALRYSPAGTPIAIDATQTDDLVGITVTNQSENASLDDLQHYTVTPWLRPIDHTLRPRGLGVGLYLSDQIIRHHGGDFGCAVSPGQLAGMKQVSVTASWPRHGVIEHGKLG